MRTFRISKIIFLMVVVAAIFMFATSFSFAATAYNASGQINMDDIILRKSPSTSSKKITTLKNNQKITIIEEVFTSKTSTSAKYRWYYISCNNKKGYVMTKRVDNIKYSATSGKITYKVNYRKGAGIKMSKVGSLAKGKAVTVYLKARPVSSAKGSSSTWYKIKISGKYCYVCSSAVDIVGSIFVNNVSTDSNTNKQNTGSSSYSSSSEFESYLESQGFPNSYKSKLRKLHNNHPNWVFVAKQTGIDWNNAVSKESANGVSLVSSSLPVNYRSTDSNSFKSGSRKIYKTANTSSKELGKIANLTKFTLYSEIWSGKTQWSYIKTSSGIKGYVKGALYNQSYSTVITGIVNASDSLNIRSGAGTSNSCVGSLQNKDKVSIVLQCKDSNGKVWYKIKNGSSYGYVSADYITLDSSNSVITKTVNVTALSSNYPKGKLSSKKDYRAVPNTNFPVIGTFKKDEEITITASVKDSSNNIWYKAYMNGNIVYIQAGNISITGTVKTADITSTVKGTTNTDVNYRKGAGTSYDRVGTLCSGTSVTITGTSKNGSELWYKVKISNKTYYMCAEYINVNLESAPSDAAPTTSSSSTVTKSATVKPSSLSGTATVLEGTWIAKDGSSWYNANSQTVAYYMDPRNFLNEDRVYMFEDLSYNASYQTVAVVNKIISGTQLPNCGFSAKMFVNAGSTYGVSPVHLAARARQETGGGSVAISGYKINGTKYYNPFNIGASSGSNPVITGMKYAANKGWSSQTKALNGGASFIASGYINAGQNSIYLQRFNVGNGLSKVATHQYMTNLTAPYSEAYTTKTAYASYGITNEALTFIIPIYKNMPGSTSLPQ